MRSSKYVQAVIQNVQEYLKKNGNSNLKKEAYDPFDVTYKAEIVDNPVLG
jgi:hypothetical protein